MIETTTTEISPTDFSARREFAYEVGERIYRDDIPLGNLIHRLLEAEIDADEALLEAARSLRDRMDRLITAVESGRQVNGLGEVQSAGGNVDRLCGMRDEAYRNGRYARKAAGMEVR